MEAEDVVCRPERASTGVKILDRGYCSKGHLILDKDDLAWKRRPPGRPSTAECRRCVRMSQRERHRRRAGLSEGEEIRKRESTVVVLSCGHTLQFTYPTPIPGRDEELWCSRCDCYQPNKFREELDESGKISGPLSDVMERLALLRVNVDGARPDPMGGRG